MGKQDGYTITTADVVDEQAEVGGWGSDLGRSRD